MICSKCNENNNYNANYCKKCGYEFNETEKKKAYEQTNLYKIKKVEEILSWLKLEKITGNKYVRIAILVIVLLMGICNIFINGNEFKILNSNSYDIQYNTTTNEYYLLSDQHTIGLNLYIPKQANNITVSTIDLFDNVIEEKTYSIDEEIILKNSNSIHYNVKANYENDFDQMIIYVYLDK